MTDKIDKNKYFFELYNAHQLKLHAFLLMMVHNEVDADDLLQETSAILWEKFEQFEPGTNFKAWAFAIAKNRACLFLRKKQQSHLLLSDEMCLEIVSVAEQVLDQQSDRIRALKECVQRLSIKDRELLKMRYRDNKVPRKLSKITGRSLSGLYKSLTRIHSLLRSCIGRTLHRWEVS